MHLADYILLKALRTTLMALNFAGIEFYGSLHPRNFTIFAGI